MGRHSFSSSEILGVIYFRKTCGYNYLDKLQQIHESSLFELKIKSNKETPQCFLSYRKWIFSICITGRAPEQQQNRNKDWKKMKRDQTKIWYYRWLFCFWKHIGKKCSDVDLIVFSRILIQQIKKKHWYGSRSK